MTDPHDTTVDPGFVKVGVIKTMSAALADKVRCMVEHEFQGWEGTISSRGYVLEVKLDMTKRPK